MIREPYSYAKEKCHLVAEDVAACVRFGISVEFLQIVLADVLV